MKRHSRTSLKALAAHLDLSPTTVSRALGGFPEVAESTRQRVQEAAKALNYNPSLSATSLATGRSRIIGHVIPVFKHGVIDPHFADALAGASVACQEAGYDLLMRMATMAEEEDAYRTLQRRQRVDGVVLHEPAMVEPRIGLLQEIGLPFIVHGRSAQEDGYDWLDVDNRGSFLTATRHLISLGHRRIALINAPERMAFAARRRNGYEDAMAEAGLQSHAVQTAMIEPNGYTAVLEALSSEGDKPTAFLFSSILPALGGLRALAEMSLSVPDDVSVMAFDDQLSFLTGGPEAGSSFDITAMRSSLHDAGREVVRLLVDRIENPTQPPKGSHWKAEFHNGSTAGPPPKS
jgi:LacI family transcriptional regulator